MVILSFASLLVTATGVIMVLTRDTTASQAGFVLSFALTASTGLLSLLELLTGLDQSMVAVERLSESEWRMQDVFFCILTARGFSMRPSVRRSAGRIPHRSAQVAKQWKHSGSRPVRAVSGGSTGCFASHRPRDQGQHFSPDKYDFPSH